MRNRHARTWLVAAAAVLLLVGCGSDDDPTGPTIPDACFDVAVLGGSPPTFSFDAGCSGASKAEGVEYRWDFQSDGTFDFPAGGEFTEAATVQWTPGSVTPGTLLSVTLEVRNAEGGVKKTTTDVDPFDTSLVVEDIGEAGKLYTWAGSGDPGFDGGNKPRLTSRFAQPADMYWTSGGDAYILDWNNHCIRKLETDGTLRTVVGEPTFPGDGPGVFYPDEDDRIAPVPGLHSFQNHPTQLEEMPDGRLLLAAWHNHKVRLFDPAAETVLVICGDRPGFRGDGGPHSEDVRFRQVEQIRLLGNDLYILDQVNLRVRRILGFLDAGQIDANSIIETVVGNGNEDRVYDVGQEGGSPLNAQLNYVLSDNPPMNGALTFDGQGRLYISDTLNHIVRRVDFGANTIHTIAGTPTEAGYSGDGGLATDAKLDYPLDLEIGPDGRLYIADEHNHAIRAVDLSTGVITTVAGRGESLVPAADIPTSWEIGDGRVATEAYLHFPRGIAFDPQGRLHIVDTFQYRIRRMVLAN